MTQIGRMATHAQPDESLAIGSPAQSEDPAAAAHLPVNPWMV
jgi:hypothetical protein